MYTVSELTNKSANEYSEFGQPYSAFPISKDLCSKCIAGGWLNNPDTAQLDMCSHYMPQRCAATWDSACNQYYQSLTDIIEQQKFLSRAAEYKYCRLADGSNCALKCQPMDPIAQDSPSVCSYYGNETLKDSTNTVDIGYYTSVNVSPDYLSRCNLTCDKISSITDTDPVINTCLATGLCGKEVSNICNTALASGTSINNQALSSLCTTLAVHKSPNPVQTKTSIAHKLKENSKLQSLIGMDSITKIFIVLLLIALFFLIYLSFHKKSSRHH